MWEVLGVTPDEALGQAVRMLQQAGHIVSPRGAQTLEYPGLVLTNWMFPQKRVMFNPARNANPFFHLMEALWILQGRKDVRWLTLFNKRMANFSDDGTTFHAPYGYRIKDQLPKVIEHLRNNPETRRAVLQIWDWELDLGTDSLDLPCNDMVFFKLRNGRLNMTVCCRSNDMLWGAYGANVVQFSILQEYVACKLGVELGQYSQLSDSFHVYLEGAGGELWAQVKEANDAGNNFGGRHAGYSISAPDTHLPTVKETPLLTSTETPDMLDDDIEQLFWAFDSKTEGLQDLWRLYQMNYATQFFNQVVKPMLEAWHVHKRGHTRAAATLLESQKHELNQQQAYDWIQAGADWLRRKHSN